MFNYFAVVITGSKVVKKEPQEAIETPAVDRGPCKMLLESIKDMVSRSSYETSVLCSKARAVQSLLDRLGAKAKSSAAAQTRKLRQQVAAAKQALREAKLFSKQHRSIVKTEVATEDDLQESQHLDEVPGEVPLEELNNLLNSRCTESESEEVVCC